MTSNREIPRIESAQGSETRGFPDGNQRFAVILGVNMNFFTCIEKSRAHSAWAVSIFGISRLLISGSHDM